MSVLSRFLVLIVSLSGLSRQQSGFSCAQVLAWIGLAHDLQQCEEKCFGTVTLHHVMQGKPGNNSPQSILGRMLMMKSDKVLSVISCVLQELMTAAPKLPELQKAAPYSMAKNLLQCPVLHLQSNRMSTTSYLVLHYHHSLCFYLYHVIVLLTSLTLSQKMVLNRITLLENSV